MGTRPSTAAQREHVRLVVGPDERRAPLGGAVLRRSPTRRRSARRPRAGRRSRRASARARSCDDGHSAPRASVVDEGRAGQQQAGDGEREHAGAQRARSARRSAARCGGARGGAARRGSPMTPSMSACRRPRKPSASATAATAATAVSPAASPPRRISSSETNSGDGGRPASAPRLTPIAVAVGRLAASDARRGAVRGVGIDAQQRQRGVEAERLGERVAGDVDDDAGDRERGAEADPERDHAHVLEARVGQQALPRQRPPQERDGDDHARPGRTRGTARPRSRRPRRRRASPSRARRRAPRSAAAPRTAAR